MSHSDLLGSDPSNRSAIQIKKRRPSYTSFVIQFNLLRRIVDVYYLRYQAGGLVCLSIARTMQTVESHLIQHPALII